MRGTRGTLTLSRSKFGVNTNENRDTPRLRPGIRGGAAFVSQAFCPGFVPESRLKSLAYDLDFVPKPPAFVQVYDLDLMSSPISEAFSLKSEDLSVKATIESFRLMSSFSLGDTPP